MRARHRWHQRAVERELTKLAAERQKQAAAVGSPRRRLVLTKRRRPKPGDNAAAQPAARDRTVAALQALFEASGAEDAARAMRLSPETADEEAVRDLARRSRELVPVLAELRGKAVDRTALLGGAPEAAEAPGSDEVESGPEEFCLSSSESAEDLGPGPEGGPRKQPRKGDGLGLALLPGWRVERAPGGTCREFVDPQGRRYRTVEQARRALDDARRSENMASRLRDKFAAKFAAREAAAEAAAGVQ